MSKQDLEFQTNIKVILEGSHAGQRLQEYFEALADKHLRRALSVLSSIYPAKTTVADEEFAFILYLFSERKFFEQESFFQFVSAVNILNFTERQKKLLRGVLQNNLEILYGKCTFELDSLLVKVFEPADMLNYLETLIAKGNLSVLQSVSGILLYEDFSHITGLDNKIAALKQQVAAAIKKQSRHAPRDVDS